MPNEKPAAAATLLIAEHDRVQRYARRRMLEHAGFRVLEADSGPCALQLAKDTPPDLVLLDLQLSDSDSLAICRSLKSCADTSNVPVIQTSAYPLDSAQIVKCLESGADDCIVYPIPGKELLARVTALIRLRNAGLQRTNHLLNLQADTFRKLLARLTTALQIAQLGVWEVSAQPGVWIGEPISAFVVLDKRCRQLFGIAEDSPMPLAELFAHLHPEDRAPVQEKLCAALELYGSGVFEAECRILHADRGERSVAMRANAILPDGAGSKLIKLVGTLMDISDRKRTEELVIRSEKVAALGRMAATLAHEINNPLAAVMNTLFLARSSAISGEPVMEYLDVADEQLRRVCNITRRALGFYREASTPTRVAIDELLNETLALFKDKIGAKRVRLTTEYDGDVQVTAVMGELRQVFSNIIANSLDAITDNGTIKLRASRIAALHNGNASVRITIADDGEGIAPSAVAHLFEPLFTTKGIGGTGLGLWVSKQLIGKHGGSIRVRSCTHPPHKGTAFSIVLPAAPGTAEPSEPNLARQTA